MNCHGIRHCQLGLLLVLPLGGAAAQQVAQPVRPRAGDVGVVVGVLPTGQHNAITDVGGVRVGHATVIQGDSVRTGVTAIIPHDGNLYTQPVPAWIHVGNGYGKLLGETQVREFGEIETPIMLTCTLCVWTVGKSLVEYMLAHDPPGTPPHTINPIVGETNDSRVNDMWRDPVKAAHVKAALESAAGGPVAEGSVGAGTGTSALGFKGGIGTSSRRVPASQGGYTVGVLVQSNFGGNLTINGAPVGRELGTYPFRGELQPATGASSPPRDDGSIMMVLATDAPLDARGLERLAARAMMGLARTGSYAANSSGDYVIAFSTAASVRRMRSSPTPLKVETLLPSSQSGLFLAAVEATEEAVLNSLFRATTQTGKGNTIEALPIERTVEILKKYNALNWDKTLPPGRPTAPR
ncbi:MAG: P1 family peptidase [Gemmatimonadetes bacterium]|nr:P1 family peptidase [Gemmatimonadota bacterium]